MHMSILKTASSAALFALGVLASAALGRQPETQPAPTDTSASDFRFTVGSGYEYGFRSNLQDTGDVRISRFTFNLGVGRKLSDDLDMSLERGVSRHPADEGLAE